MKLSHEHDWTGLILIKDESGATIATLEKHAAGQPGSGAPADAHAKAQDALAKAAIAHAATLTNGPGAKARILAFLEERQA